MTEFKTEIIEKETNIKEFITPYINKWKLFLISIFITSTLAYVYIKLVTPKYKVEASILVKDEQGNGSNSLNTFSGLGFDIGGVKSKLENEIEILKSRTLISKVVKDLKSNITFYEVKRFGKQELFSNTFINVNFIDGDSSIYKKKGELEINIISPTFFLLKEKNITKKLAFGRTIKTSLGKIIITPKNNQKITNKKLLINVIPFDKTVDLFQSKFNVSSVSKESSAIKISTETNNIEKGITLINSLIKQHSNDVINDKNEVDKNTLDFINERLKKITNELSIVEGNVSNFKSDNKIFDLSLNTGIYFENEAENEKLLLENSTQIKLAEYIYEYVNKNKLGQLIPSNIGLDDNSVSQLIETINSIIIERNKLRLNSSEKNPIIINLNNQIKELSDNLTESLKNYKKTLQIRNKELKEKNKQINSNLTSAPNKEKDFKEIARQQQIKESLYLYLLQKKEETSLSLAVTVSNTKIIDKAYSNGLVVSPKKSLIYIFGFLIGFFIPVIIIYLSNLLNTKIHSKLDLEKHNLTFIGDIPLLDKNQNEEKLVVSASSNDGISEAFRLLRTNIHYLIKNKTDKAKVIFTTSTIAKEGKSFISLNLATALSLMDKKVLLVGMDLRAPKLLDYLNFSNKKGVTNFIIDKDLSINDIIIKSNSSINFDIIPSGDIPPNPSELLLSDRLDFLFREIESKYDYIIVDTAPVAPVTDTLLIAKYSDIILYIVRAEYLDKRMLNIPESLNNEEKLPNMHVVINGQLQQSSYGYGYGYGGTYVTQEQKPWYKRLFTS